LQVERFTVIMISGAEFLESNNLQNMV
jgi:hypothetical protein